MTEAASNANQKVKLILSKILEEYDLGAGIGPIRLETEHFLLGTGIDNDQLKRMLERLEKDFVLESFVMDGRGGDPVCFLKPLNHFKSRAEDYIERLSEGEVSSKPIANSILYLDKVGNLWHGDKEHFCYSMAATRNRLAIVKSMTENKGYQTTKSIASALDKKDQNVRTEINKIRKKIKHHLGLDDLIESQPGLGYRINPKYIITIVK